MKPKKLICKYLTLTLFMIASMDATSAYSDVVIIVSAESKVTTLTVEEINRIFLGKADTFPNHNFAVPIDQPEGNEIRNEFYSKVILKSPSQLAAYWAKIIFTGDGRPPMQLEGDLSVKKAVSENPNAIGYIDRRKVDGSVRVLYGP